MTARGSFCLVLHTHLPFVHHPEHASFLEEGWYFEAVAESYLPLLFILDDLAADGVPVRLALNLTAPLMSMARAPSLHEKTTRFLERRRRLAELEVTRRAGDVVGLEAARHYLHRHEQMCALWQRLDGDLVGAFARHAAAGRVETMACGATHGFLPLLATDAAAAAQIEIGQREHERAFGARARGFWLPECAWRPGLEELLGAAGVEWIVLDGHGVRDAQPAPPAGTYRPIDVGSGICAFGRDGECSEQVWSTRVGYPGDPVYRELYRDLGYDADYAYIRPFLESDGVRRNVGLKFHRVTGEAVPLHEKEPWSPSAARERTRVHAGNFLFNRSEQVKHHAARLGEDVVIAAPFDTELFGHWWYEGPWFIEEVFRQAAAIGADLPFRIETPSDVLDRDGSRPAARPGSCTWGRNGFNEVWLSERNQWCWPYLHEMEVRMTARADEWAAARPERRRLLRQLARELLLAQSSDWLFIIEMQTSAYYAERRFRDHVHRFFAIDSALDDDDYDEHDLARVERQDCVFADVDPTLWLGLDGLGRRP